ncbi:MAG: N-acetylmuramoyl-L-alanine amidase [Alphaproteobacteria bacterium]|nr:N-acetylmuramoyl-L-alanine amidase [Alphaproteobacteria bacterium]
MTMKHLPSPNFDSRDGHSIDMLVLHYTGMRTAQEALERLCDASAKVSAHYVVDEDGTVYQLVAEEHRAWHAGVSSWRGHTNINQRSIGIEIVNPGHEFGYRPFHTIQMEAVATLCKNILSRHNIPARNVVGHSDVAPSRKEDPGELFDWKFLAEQGVGFFPDAPKAIVISAAPDIQMLAEYGYEISDPIKTIIAFQRHFRQDSLTEQWDSRCAALLAALLTLV